MPVDYILNPPLGIDLGTTFSAIAKWNGILPEVYKTGGKRTFETYQSVVFFDEPNGAYLTDRLAYKKTGIDPEHGIVGIKRKMDNRDETIFLGSKVHSPMEISAKILKGIHREVASMYPAGEFRGRNVVVTVPYYFKAHQCANTREAVELAELDCVGILQEPIAASLQYALQMIRDYPSEERDEVILVFDLGGGTFDLTLFQLKCRPKKLSFEVLASAGDDRLGGLDFDQALADYVLNKESIDLTDLDPRQQRRSMQKLLESCLDIKESLSGEGVNSWPLFLADIKPGTHIERDIQRKEFEECIRPYTEKIERCLIDVFARAGVATSAVTRVIKVGGSSKIPIMSSLLQDYIGENKIYGNTNASLCVAEGAAIYAAYLDDPEVFGREIEITTRSCHALGIEISGGEFHEIIPANCKTPCARSQIFEPESPDQVQVNLEVYQGSGKHVKDNSKIGTVTVQLHPDDGPKPEIEVIFKQDAEQMLKVKVEITDKKGHKRIEEVPFQTT